MNQAEINRQFNECKLLVEQEHYSKAIPIIKAIIDTVSSKYVGQEVRYYSFNHILETYYYAYFFKDVSKLNYTEENINSYYRLYGFALMKVNRLDEAIMAYNAGLDWNPVDLETLMQLGELYKLSKNFKSLRKVSNESYKLCCTRATLARYYRNLGYYYLESYKPEVARALYTYSNIYFETENAKTEISFLDKAQPQYAKEMSVKELQAIIQQEGIPLGPDSNTLGITFRVGQIELDNGNYQNAADCMAMVYDLTEDDEAKQLMETAISKLNTR